MTATPKIAIIGAGPGGCMLARLLTQRSIPCIIYEAEPSPDYRSQGGTLDLRSNTGLAAIRAAGLYDQFRKLARYDGEYMLITDKKLTTWMKRSPGKEGKSNGVQEAPEIDRKVLRKMLFECLPPDVVRWGHKLLRVDEKDLSLHFADGSVESGFDLIVGADGAWSKVRNLVSSEKPFYAGMGGYNFTIPDAREKAPQAYKFVNRGSVFAYSDGKNVNGQFLGDGSINVSTYSLRDEDWIKRESKEGVKTTDLVTAKQKQKDVVHGWAPELLNLIDSAQGDVDKRNLYMLPVGFRWAHKKGITLLGDAAHLMTPFAGIGVNTAFYDAMLLADAVAGCIERQRSDDLDIAIIEYEKKMLDHAHEGQKLTFGCMNDMYLTEGAPRTSIESYLLRHISQEFPRWSLPFVAAVLYTGFFFYKLFV
ncbi:FAD/NAD(P)-binding domain-containing protein [Lophiostoma macrostomum CBS 122681]|uniref:FAD/NAD(P)-binding domain-containing protein n=1 Tax=Lophiostoma macrostomum CBS 122681 TaxID=1314788 RepID=A0A6A6TDQ4_9PLEO|nr:FAD/NAD(P)-binding domain-containing protein [Lophiostoma macrostomum CBS 122681]